MQHKNKVNSLEIKEEKNVEEEDKNIHVSMLKDWLMAYSQRRYINNLTIEKTLQGTLSIFIVLMVNCFPPIDIFPD